MSLRALVPKAQLLALTATASPAALRTMKKELEMPTAVIVKVSPNRRNIFLQRRFRAKKGNDISFGDILKPIAQELGQLKGDYPLTIVYAKLTCMAIVFKIFSKYVNDMNAHGLRRFAMFHSSTEQTVKSLVINELGKTNSYIRVVVATQALGMGVDTKHVRHVIHITPSSSLESYFQEIGRAGRDGEEATATLWFNKSDIARNRTNLSDQMKEYCMEDGCLRAFILSYFGFRSQEQARCCSNCNPVEAEVAVAVEALQPRFREPPANGDLPR